MKKLKKILLIISSLAIISVGFLPTILKMTQMYKINYGAIYNILNMFTDSIIVKASDDYIYSGNMLFISDKDQGISSYYYDDVGEGVRLYTVVTPLDEVQYEYSVNEAEFTECEYPLYGTKLLNLNKEVNTIVVRRKEDKEVASKALLINDGNGGWIVLQYRYKRYDEGPALYTLNYGYDLGYKELYEFSLDGGETFYNIYNLWTNNYFIDYSMKTNAADLFNKQIIIRNRETNEIVYKTPTLEEIEEEYTYENGKTTVNFKQEGFEESEFLYEYIINGEIKSGSNIEFNEDTENIMLHISGEKEFTTINSEKQINVKVIKVNEPKIEVTDNKLEITQGEIVNDEVGEILYSVDGGEYLKYTEKVNLDPGTHTIKAYVVSKDKEVKGNEIEKEITIEKQEETKIDEEEKTDNNEKNEIQSKPEDTNKTNKNQTTPKTSDDIIKIIGILSVIVIINILIFKIRKNK